MRKINSTFRTEFISEEGNRLINRDYFAYIELDDLACYVLADGLDEDDKLNSAEIAVISVLRAFSEHPSIRKRAILRYIKEAHRALEIEKKGMKLKASITVVVTNYIKIRYASVGNSRFCLFRNDRIIKRSEDQSLTEYLVEAEYLARDKAALHEERNNLSAYLGMNGRLKVQISKKITLQDADAWFLFTRGIWEFCDEGELSDSAIGAKEPQEVLNNVEELIMSKQPQELDNYTLAVTYIDKIYKKPQKKVTFKKVLMVLLPILLILVVLFIVWFVNHKKRIDQTNQMKEFIISGEKYILYDNYKKAAEDYGEALKLSKTLKLKEESKELDQLTKLFEQILAADQMLKDENYIKADEFFAIAQDLSFENGNVAKNYIESQRKNALLYIEVYDLLEKGDALLELDDIEGARLYYLQAKECSNQLLFKDGRQEANAKIAEADEKLANEKAEVKAADKEKKEEEEALKKEEDLAKSEAERIQKEEDEKKEQQKEELAAAEEEARIRKEEERQRAIGFEEKGNLSYESGDYMNALLYFESAKELYGELGLNQRVTAAKKKIALTEQMIGNKKAEQTKAEEYVEAATGFLKDEKYEKAILSYNMALNIYEKNGYTDQAETVKNMIEVLEKLITK